MPIPVTCSRCGVNHQADNSLAGTRAKCACGHILTIPQAESAKDQDDAFWGELDRDIPLAREEAFASPTPTPEEEGRQSDAMLYKVTMAQLESGVPPGRVIQDLRSRGLSKEDAVAIVRHLAPRGYTERADNRVAGRARMLRGVIALTAGILVGIAGHHVGLIVLAAFVLILIGLFQLGVGLIGFVTGAQ